MKLFILALLFPVTGFAGVLNGGGGKGVLCETVGQAPTLRVLDVYEAALRWPELPLRADLTAELQLALHGFNLVWAEPGEVFKSEPSRDAVEKAFRTEFFDKIIYIPKGARIPVTEDATIPVLAPNCRQVQIAVYTTLGIEIDREYWEMLTPRDQAALAVHEALYFYRRTYGAVNSDETRAFVGRLYSSYPPVPRFEGAPATGFIDCKAGKAGSPIYDFAVYLDASGDTIMSFRQIDNATTLGRTYLKLTGQIIFNSLKDSSSQFGMNSSLQSDFKYEDRSFNMRRQTTGGPVEISLRNAKNEDYGASLAFCKMM